jgi:two-component system cell cycle sensor histidine kinase/response regulator CckA
MSTSEARALDSVGTRMLAELGRGGGLMAILAVVFAAGALLLAVLASRSSDPLLLTILSSLALTGLFFLFALAAGHVRIGERVDETDFVHAAADALPDAVLLTSADSGIVYANAAAERLLPHGGSLLGGSLAAIVSGGGDVGEAMFRLTRAAERGEELSEELRLVPIGGTGAGLRLFRASVKPFTISGHEREMHPLALWQLTDITAERVRDERRLETLKSAIAQIDAMPTGFIVAERSGLIQRANSVVLDWLGITQSHLRERGLRLQDLLSGDGAQLLARAASGAAGTRARLELDMIREDGRLLPVHVVAGPGVEDGQLLLSISNREITPSDEQNGVAAEVRFARFFQSAPFGIATIGGDGRVVSANAAFARMIVDSSGGISEPAVDALAGSAPDEVRQAISGAVTQALGGRANVVPVEITVGAKKEYVRRVFIHPFLRSPNAREAAIAYVVDATEEKALEAKFAQSQKMEAVGRLAGFVAHDFNNMLTGIIGFSDFLLQSHKPSDPAHADIMNIRKSAVRAAGLVGKLLALARQQTLQLEPMLLDEMVADVAPLMKRSIGEKIELKTQYGRDLWYVRTDKLQLEQAILNLAVNARDAMPGGGTLTVRTRNITERESKKLDHHGMPAGEYVLIEVEDTGTGMPPEVLAKIFEPFFTTKAVGKGTGLGLATVYGIVKQTGGFIYPESTVGKGTTFRIYLPRHMVEPEVEAQMQKAARKEPASSDLTGTGRVLLVEDEDVVRSFAARALKSRGYEVLEAGSGVEALEVMANNDGRVDIVVSDVVMPEMDGPTLLKELRKSNPELKFIFVSGYPNDAFRESVGNEEFAFLPKPFSLPQLAAKVKEQLAL